MSSLYIDVKNGLDEVTFLKLLMELVDSSKEMLELMNTLFVIHAKEDMKSWIQNLNCSKESKTHILNILEKLKEKKIRVTKKDLVLISSIVYVLENLEVKQIQTSPLAVKNFSLFQQELSGEWICIQEKYCSDFLIVFFLEYNLKTIQNYELQLDKIAEIKNKNGLLVQAYYTKREKNKIIELVTNIDDMSGEYLAYAIEELYKAGALDVYSTSIQMKKGRTGIMITCMCHEKDREKMLHLIFQNTSTIGVREYASIRYGLEKENTIVHTKYGSVHSKISRGYDVIKQKYEYEDLARIARKRKIPIQEVIKLVEGEKKGEEQ